MDEISCVALLRNQQFKPRAMQSCVRTHLKVMLSKPANLSPIRSIISSTENEIMTMLGTIAMKFTANTVDGDAPA